MQELLDEHCANMTTTSQHDLMKVLSGSYERLPSNAHRRMFLDAALLLRGCRPAQLTALWEGQLLLDENGIDNKEPLVRQLPARRNGESRAAWHIRQQAAAPGKAAALLADLEKLLLVRSEPREDVHATIRR